LSPKNYVVKIKGVDPKFYEKPFGRQLDEWRLIEDFKAKAKSVHVDAKRKATLSAVRAYLKDHKVTEYFACWGKDSSDFKDDSVEVFIK
jgi:hypothetical protein